MANSPFVTISETEILPPDRKSAIDISENLRLVWRKVDDAIRDDNSASPSATGRCSMNPSRNSTVGLRLRVPRYRGLWQAFSGVMSTPDDVNRVAPLAVPRENNPVRRLIQRSTTVSAGFSGWQSRSGSPQPSEKVWQCLRAQYLRVDRGSWNRTRTALGHTDNLRSLAGDVRIVLAH